MSIFTEAMSLKVSQYGSFYSQVLNIKFNIINIDHNSKKEDLNQLKKQLDESGFENTIISLNIESPG